MNSPVEQPASEAALASPAGGSEVAADATPLRPRPIPAPSHPLQFRAIGLVRGRYERSEKLNQGTLVVEDETQTAVDAVLLGRTIGVIKNHVDLDLPHLWVVYPRTHPKERTLQFQVVGIWEPETLKAGESQEQAEAAADPEAPDTVAPETAVAVAPPPQLEPTVESTATGKLAPKPQPVPPVARPLPVRQNGTDPEPPRAVPLPQVGSEFSIRGEVVFYSEESEKIVVKIKQAPRQEGDRPKSFKLEMQGKLPTNRALRQFWDLLVQLQGSALIVRDAVSVGPVKPKKKPRPQKPIRRKVVPSPQRAGERAPISAAGTAPEGAKDRPRPRRVIEKPRRRNRES